MVHKVAGLFAGIGGLELGLSRAGHHTQLLCEIDPSASAVLKHHPDFHTAQLTQNVCQLKGEDLRSVSLIAAGFPCQDLSQAGRTQGLDGKNSGLIGEVFRLLREEDVPEVLLENVPFMMQLSRGAALEKILSEFERMGYSWAYRVIDALAFGLPQRRERIFIIASKIRDPRTILLSG
ncbi:MAG TPA: DNA cytosine methyltransferase, partial [Chromatiaceae bacterium]|nr:DNA cytosine methyltransferase [Chromatiaceae bacterium]